jgi:hypothetical protein
MLLEIFEQGKQKSEVACSKHISFEGFKWCVKIRDNKYLNFPLLPSRNFKNFE